MERTKHYNYKITEALRSNKIYIIAEKINEIFKSVEVDGNPDCRNLMQLLTYLSKNDNDLRNSIELRKDLLRSYDKSINDWQIEAVDKSISEDILSSINEQFAEIVATVSELPCDLQSYGQVLLQVNIENGTIESPLPANISCEIVPQTEFQRDNETDCKVYSKADGLIKVNLIGRDKLAPSTKEAFIYLQNDEQFAGGSLKSLALRAALHINDMLEWANYNQKLQGLIAVQYDMEKLYGDLTQMMSQFDASMMPAAARAKIKAMNKPQEKLNNILATVLDAVKDIGKNKVASYPNSIDVKHNNVVSNQNHISYSDFDRNCKTIYETEYLGQSTLTGTSTTGSYGTGAGLKTMYTNTLNKERKDRTIATSIMNKILSYYWTVWKGANSEPLLRFKYGTESSEDIKQNIQIFQMLSSLNMSESFVISKQDFAQKLGLPFDANIQNGEANITIGGSQPSILGGF